MFTNRNPIEVNGMKKAFISVVKRLYKDQQGQAIWFALLSMMTMLGMGGFMIDLGRFYIVRSQLQLSTNAAGLAAAGSIYDSQSTSTATTVAKNYIANNPLFGLTEVTNYPVVVTTCLNGLITSPQNCSTMGNVQNAIKIVERVQMPTTFMSLFGFKYLITQAEATASMTGAAQTWNIALIVDTTGSMADTNTVDSDCSGDTNLQCALHGAQTLLGSMNPCVSVASCTNSTANVHVALFAFPNMLTTALSNAFTGCSGTGTPNGAPNTANPTTMWYAPITLPEPGLTGYTPLTYTQANLTSTNSNPLWTATGTNSWSASYEITLPSTATPAGYATDADANGFLSNYYDASNSSSGYLNTSSSLVKAIGYTGSFGCLPVSPNGIDLNSATNAGPGSTELHDSVASGTANKNGEWSGGGVQSTATTTIDTVGVGEGITYIAPVIYAAQAALVSEQALNVSNGMPAGNNAMIVLSDGGMNAQWIYFPQGQLQPPTALACPAGISGTSVTNPNNCMFNFQKPGTANPTAATFTSGSGSTSYSFNGFSGLSSSTANTTPSYTAYVESAYNPGSGTQWLSDLTGGKVTNTGQYPDFVDECQQAIVAANYATAQGTRVYSVAYQASGSCASGNHADNFTDATLVATGTYNSGTFAAVTDVTDCLTMEDVASSLTYFYSDSGASGSSTCPSPDWPDITSLSGIFGNIETTFSSPRLLPNTMT